MIAKIQALHAAFNRAVPECECVLNMFREHEWWEWLKWREDEQRFNASDLELVVAYRRKLLAEGRQYPGCLKFSNLIGRPDRFEEDLGLARNAPRKPTGKALVLEQSGRPAQQEKPVKLAGPLAAAALDRLRGAVQ